MLNQQIHPNQARQTLLLLCIAYTQAKNQISRYCMSINVSRYAVPLKFGLTSGGACAYHVNNLCRGDADVFVLNEQTKTDLC